MLRSDRAISDQGHSDRRPQPGWPVNRSLTMPMQAWRRSRWHRKSSRQLQAEADGVTPAGFFCIRHRATLASPAVAQFVSAFLLRVLAEVPRKQGKVAAEHSQRIVEEHQVYCSTL